MPEIDRSHPAATLFTLVYLLPVARVACSKFKGTQYPDQHVIVGAHHDDRGSFLNPRAPGADDDGSGSSMLLQIARIIKANNLSFGRTLVISAFSGEGNQSVAMPVFIPSQVLFWSRS